MNPNAPSRRPAQTALRGWRARVWAWVLFAALLKGLVPHAALASMVMGNDPAAVLCSPSLSNGVLDAKAEQASSQMAGHAHCLCANGDATGLPPMRFSALGPPSLGAPPLTRLRTAFASAEYFWPPSRGPPR